MLSSTGTSTGPPSVHVFPPYQEAMAALGDHAHIPSHCEEHLGPQSRMPVGLWADTDSHGLYQLSLEPRNRAGHRERETGMGRGPGRLPGEDVAGIWAGC